MKEKRKENLKIQFHQQKPVAETQRIPPQGSKLPKRPNAKSASSTATNQAKSANGTSDASAKKSAASLAAAERRDAQRQQLLELKRRNKQATQQTVEKLLSEPETSS